MTNTIHPNKHNWVTILVWIVVTIVGGLIIDILPQMVLVLVSGESWLAAVIWNLGGAVFGLIAGVIVGLSQWLTLYRRVEWARHWLRGTILGWTLGGTLLMLLNRIAVSELVHGDPTSNSGTIIMLGAWFAAGAGIGLVQWLALRRYMKGGLWWIVISSSGWGLGGIIGMSILFHTYQLMVAGGIASIQFPLFIFGLVVSGVPGLMTAVASNVLISRSLGNNLDPHMDIQIKSHV